MIKENQRLLNQLHVFSDGLLVFFSMMVAYWIRFYVFTGIEGIPFSYYIRLAAVAVALCLRQELQDAGAQVILTRDTDTALAEEGAQRKRRDLQYRVDAAREARLFLSIHMNEYRTRAESGPQVFYRAGQEDSRLLAGALQAQLIAGLRPARERSAHTGEYYLLEHLDIPAVLVECGFLSNAAEEAKLLDAGYQQQVAQAICAGVCDFIQLSGK